MKRVGLVVFFLGLFSVSSFAAEAWKIHPYKENFGLSALGGVSLTGNQAAFGIMGTASKKILHDGFFPDMTNQVHLEIAGGPAMFSAGTALQYSIHLRWDFHYNDFWTFYGLGGFGGFLPAVVLGNSAQFHPRFGAGALWHFFSQFSFRMEISHEFTGVGIMFQI